jgi:glycosyltransferase involved in cell wall biosynthesis
VEPRLGPQDRVVGVADATYKRELLSGARCLLFPVQWEEPFGMVMIEAMACGTPVVATPRGSVPEIVSDGRTGFVRGDEAELGRAVRRVGELDRRACREEAACRFSATRMVAEHLALFARVTGSRSTALPVTVPAAG